MIIVGNLPIVGPLKYLSVEHASKPVSKPDDHLKEGKRRKGEVKFEWGGGRGF